MPTQLKVTDTEMLAYAVQCLREIADMGRKAGSETAKNWLLSHGYARTAGGYVPGKGFEDTAETHSQELGTDTVRTTIAD